jgi:hypothetical protein
VCLSGRHDIQQNETRHKGLIHDTKRNKTLPLFIVMLGLVGLLALSLFFESMDPRLG